MGGGFSGLPPAFPDAGEVFPRSRVFAPLFFDDSLAPLLFLKYGYLVQSPDPSPPTCFPRLHQACVHARCPLSSLPRLPRAAFHPRRLRASLNNNNKAGRRLAQLPERYLDALLTTGPRRPTLLPTMGAAPGRAGGPSKSGFSYWGSTTSTTSAANHLLSG